MRKSFPTCLVVGAGIVFAAGALCFASSQTQDAKEDQRSKRRNARENVQSREGRGRRAEGAQSLQVAEMAPQFALKSLDGKSETDVASYRGQRPIILFFGSYT